MTSDTILTMFGFFWIPTLVAGGEKVVYTHSPKKKIKFSATKVAIG